MPSDHRCAPAAVPGSSVATCTSSAPAAASSSPARSSSNALSSGTANGRVAAAAAKYASIAAKMTAIWPTHSLRVVGNTAAAEPKTSASARSASTNRRPRRWNGPYSGLNAEWCSRADALVLSPGNQSPRGVKADTSGLLGGTSALSSRSSGSTPAGSVPSPSSPSPSGETAHGRGTYTALSRVPVIENTRASDAAWEHAKPMRPMPNDHGALFDCDTSTREHWVMGWRKSRNHT
mmetsp:Transcript_16365/g.50781  ORF Transcript_16365/g.50781 Transcript_16365/m.50781 type:complete len:235 (-) Transcript_16365:193-897(-)